MVSPLQQPIDYFSQLADFDVGKAIDQHVMQGQQQAALQAQQQRALAQQTQADAAMKAALENPSPEAYRTALLTNPGLKDQITAASSSWNDQQRKTNLEDIGALYTLPPEAAVKRLNARIDADRINGDDTADDEEMRDLLKTNPSQAKAYIGLKLAGVMGPDKFAEAYGTLAKTPGEVAKTTADTGLVQAQTTKTTEEAKQVAPLATAERGYKAASVDKMAADVANAASRLNLDQARLQADVDLKTRELDLKEGDLSDGARSAVNTAVTAAVASRQQSDQLKSLADQLVEAGGSGGLGASAASALTGLTGNASKTTQLRRQYATIKNSIALGLLPPGSASEKEGKWIRQGFPPDDASVATMVEFLNTMGDVQAKIADQQDRKAEWMAGNKGSLGPARTGFFVGNTFVQPGMRFDDIEKPIRKEQAQAAAAARVQK